MTRPPRSRCRICAASRRPARLTRPFAGLVSPAGRHPTRSAADIPALQLEALEVALLLRPAGTSRPAPTLSAWPCWPRCASCLRVRARARWPSTTSSGCTRRSLDALTFALRRVTAGRCRSLLAARTDVPAYPLTFRAPPLPHCWRDLLAAAPATSRSSCRPAVPVAGAASCCHRGDRRAGPTGGPAVARQPVLRQRDLGYPVFCRAPCPAPGSHADRPTPLADPARRRRAGRRRRRRADRAPPTRWSSSGYLYTLPPRSTRRCWPGSSSRPTTAHRRPPADRRRGGRVHASRRRAQLYQRLAAAGGQPGAARALRRPGRRAGPRPEVAAALDAAAEAAHARAGTPRAGQFAAQAVEFTPAADTAALARRRIRAGELLFLAGDMVQSLACRPWTSATWPPPRLATADLERVSALAGRRDRAAARRRARRRARHPLGRRPPAASPGGARWCWRWPPTPPTACPAAAGPPRPTRSPSAVGAGSAAAASLHRALLNLVIAKVTAGEGLDCSLLAQAAPLEPELPPGPLHYTADLYRGLWSRFVEDLDTSRAALRAASPAPATPARTTPLSTFLYLPGRHRGAALLLPGRGGGRGRRRRRPTPGTTGRRPPGTSSPAATC